MKSDLYQKYFKGCRLVYIPRLGFDFETNMRNFKDMLAILGIDAGTLHPITRAERYEYIVLPDESFFSAPDGPFFTEEFSRDLHIIRDFALKHRVPSPHKKVYFFYGRRTIGEDRMAEYFRSKGYSIFLPAKLSLPQQMNLLINCESFASTVGSCSHNVMFLRDNTEVILIPRADFVTPYQTLFDQVNNLNITYVDSSLSVCVDNNARHLGTFFYIVSKQLRKYFGDYDEKTFEYSDADFRSFITYFKHSASQGLNFNPDALKYYGSVFAEFFEQLSRQETLLREEHIAIV